MYDFLNRAKEKVTIPLLYAIVPLESIPFLFDMDSIIGKLLLICKFFLVLLFYLLYMNRISRRKRFILSLLTIVMIYISIKNKSYGFFLIMMILFVSLTVFPAVEILDAHRKNLLLLLGSITFGVFIYTLIRPITIAKKYFFLLPAANISCYGVVNPNTCAYLILATFFFFVSYFEKSKSKKNKWVAIPLICITTWFLCFIECRSALLVIIVFVIGYLLNRRKLMKSTIYYIEIFAVSIFCLLYYVLWNNISNLEQTENGMAFLGKDIFSGREEIWKVALEGFVNKPLLGNGSKYLLEITGTSSAHNVLLSIMVIMGAIPALGYLYFLLSLYGSFTINVENKGYLTIPQLCFIACIISTAFECSFTDARLNFLFLPLLLLDNVRDERRDYVQAIWN